MILNKQRLRAMQIVEEINKMSTEAVKEVGEGNELREEFMKSNGVLYAQHSPNFEEIYLYEKDIESESIDKIVRYKFEVKDYDKKEKTKMEAIFKHSFFQFKGRVYYRGILVDKDVVEFHTYVYHPIVSSIKHKKFLNTTLTTITVNLIAGKFSKGFPRTHFIELRLNDIVNKLFDCGDIVSDIPDSKMYHKLFNDTNIVCLTEIKLKSLDIYFQETVIPVIRDFVKMKAIETDRYISSLRKDVSDDSIIELAADIIARNRKEKQGCFRRFSSTLIEYDSKLFLQYLGAAKDNKDKGIYNDVYEILELQNIREVVKKEEDVLEKLHKALEIMTDTCNFALKENLFF